MMMQPENAFASRAGMVPPAADSPMPAPVGGSAPGMMTPQPGARLAMPLQSTVARPVMAPPAMTPQPGAVGISAPGAAAPVAGGATSMLQHPDIQNFLRQRLMGMRPPGQLAEPTPYRAPGAPMMAQPAAM